MLQMAAWPQVDQIVIKHDLRAANALQTRSLLGSTLTLQSPAVDRTSTNSSSGWLGNPLLFSCWQIRAEAHFQFSWQISQGFLPSELFQAKLIHCHTHACPARDTGHVLSVPGSTCLYWWVKGDIPKARWPYYTPPKAKWCGGHETEHYTEVGWIMRKYWAVGISERQHRVTESISPADPASPNAFPFTQGSVLHCIWSCWWFLMIFCMTVKAVARLCAPVPWSLVDGATQTLSARPAGYRHTPITCSTRQFRESEGLKEFRGL